MDTLNAMPVGAIARPLNPKYRTNVAIMALTPVLGVLMGALTLLQSGDLAQAAVTGFFMGATVFLSWAIAREVDPKYPISAFVAVALAAIIMLVAPHTLELFTLAMLLTGVRIVNRIVGVPPQLGDSGVVLILVGLVAAFGHWLVAIVGALIFVLDALLVNGTRLQWAFALLAAIAAVAAFLTRAGEAVLPSALVLAVLGVISAGYLWATVTTRDAGETDLAGYTLYPRRVQAGMVVVLLGAWLPVLWFGDAGAWSLSTLWATFAGITFYRVFITLRKG